MLISELAEKTGLAAHTIRFYEKEQLLDDRFIERSENNYRHYSVAALERVMMIKQGQAVGFTLSEIRELLEAWDAGELTSTEQKNYLQQKADEIAGKIAELEQIQFNLSHKLQLIHALDNGL